MLLIMPAIVELKWRVWLPAAIGLSVSTEVDNTVTTGKKKEVR
jgi:hypothetical protein